MLCLFSFYRKTCREINEVVESKGSKRSPKMCVFVLFSKAFVTVLKFKREKCLLKNRGYI